MPFVSLACLLIAIAPTPDALTLAEPGQVTLGGYLGNRVTNNAKGRLLAVNEDELLDGFRHRPGSHPWIGEHVGKFLDAATRAWAYTGDKALKAKIDRVAKGLMATQEPDGYLGTYAPGKRFGLYEGADWDVWSHKYDLLGLLTYHRYTKDPEALATCRRIGDLLLSTFGPGKKTLISAGTHMGMAATSILEPMVLLHRATGDPRYLDFARQIVAEYDIAGGPGIVKSLTQNGKVASTANGKAYEMLSNLVGLCELGRETGDKQYQRAAESAWKDVVATQLYITGTASHGEHFGKDFDLPNGVNASLGETCVTVTWIQLNAQLLRLTGDRKYADEIERSAYNHLSASQREDGNQWCYYTPLEGVKPFGNSINCCLSSGPRGMSLMPELAFQTSPGALWVSTMESATFRVPGFEVQIYSPFPLAGLSRVTVVASKSTRQALHFRIPAWAGPATLKIGKTRLKGLPGQWLDVPSQVWKGKTNLELTYAIRPKIVVGEHTNRGKVAATYGPFVLAFDQSLNPGRSPRTASLRPGAKLVGGNRLEFSDGKDLRLQPFAEVGPNDPFRVWLTDADLAPKLEAENPLINATESRSRQGNASGSIIDGDLDTYVVTFDNAKRDLDEYRVVLAKPILVDRITFVHGKTFHDGGWFDLSKGPVEYRIVLADGKVLRGEVNYPATTSTDAKGLKSGEKFTVALIQPCAITSITFSGHPASGDNPAQSFSSCAEILVRVVKK